MDDDRKRLEELVNQLNIYQGQADILKQQIETIKANLTEISLAQETLASIKDKKDAETLVPIGAGSFIITQLKDTDDVIVGLGAGAAVKKKIDDAEKSIEEQKKELETLISRMSQDLQKISQYIMEKSPEAEQLLQKLEGSPG